MQECSRKTCSFYGLLISTYKNLRKQYAIFWFNVERHCFIGMWLNKPVKKNLHTTSRSIRFLPIYNYRNNMPYNTLMILGLYSIWSSPMAIRHSTPTLIPTESFYINLITQMKAGMKSQMHVLTSISVLVISRMQIASHNYCAGFLSAAIFCLTWDIWFRCKCYVSDTGMGNAYIL